MSLLDRQHMSLLTSVCGKVTQLGDYRLTTGLPDCLHKIMDTSLYFRTLFPISLEILSSLYLAGSWVPLHFQILFLKLLDTYNALGRVH